jgi:hypothetical protein
MGERNLLVEGWGDKEFFSAYCQLLEITNVAITPKNINANKGDGCSNLVASLPILLGKIQAGDVDRLGIILDADYPPDNNGGFVNRRTLIATELKAFGYVIPRTCNHAKGEIFDHPNGLPNIGLWIMPNHKNDGMLEDFIKNLISDVTQIGLLNHASNSISKLPTTLFNTELHLTKAEVSTWRAWQKRPGNDLQYALRNGLLDRSKATNFEKWLIRVFD